jgi:hypothetical protein
MVVRKGDIVGALHNAGGIMPLADLVKMFEARIDDKREFDEYVLTLTRRRTVEENGETVTQVFLRGMRHRFEPDRTESLSDDALRLVIAELPNRELGRLAMTCRKFRDLAQEPIRERRRMCYEAEGECRCVVAVPDAADGRIVTASTRNELTVWMSRKGDTRDGACERTIQAHTDSISAVAVLPGAPLRVVSLGHSHDVCEVKLWALDGAVEAERGYKCRCPVGVPTSIAVLPDGTQVLVGRSSGHIDLVSLELRPGRPAAETFTGHCGQVNVMAVTHDGQHIISGSRGGYVKVWSVDDKSQAMSTCFGHTDDVLAVTAMRNGQLILSGSHDATVRVWRFDSTLENSFSKLHTGPVNAVVALPDNQHALSASDDCTVKLFNVIDGFVVRPFTHHTGPVRCLALLPDGLRFVSGSADRTARVTKLGETPPSEALQGRASSAPETKRREEEISMVKRAFNQSCVDCRSTRSWVKAELEDLRPPYWYDYPMPDAARVDAILHYLEKTNFLKKTGRRIGPDPELCLFGCDADHDYGPPLVGSDHRSGPVVPTYEISKALRDKGDEIWTPLGDLVKTLYPDFPSENVDEVEELEDQSEDFKVNGKKVTMVFLKGLRHLFAGL